ncbi:BTAD domain-containing putative transcriptional regulator [Microbacterium atlanticum]|uniref:BTAD domain-containing putative transcriptional regulator n=1 Tax=Microbacterium atlanticum TaxID=2782168 RepID=UPI00188773B6|nr:BTAD domain-containing putative transcriptional regulator [Microbacterium atlanticum]
MGIDIELLGAFGLRIDGSAVPVRGDLPRALLARLASTPRELVPSEELIADVWADRPENVVSTLRAHLSRLRSAGLGASIVGARGGYLIDIPRERVDLTRFRDDLAQAAQITDAEQHLARLVELAGIAGQEPLADLDGHPFLARLRADHLEERRLLDEDLAESAIELGDDSLATAVLAGTVERHPLHERPVRLLALALARSARYADALAVLDGYRERLTDQGLDASARVDALRASIVRLDPAVVAPIGIGGTVNRVGIAIPLTRFIGRGSDLLALREARRGHRLVTVVGPAGVGKTRIAVELAREATTALDDDQYMVDLADIRDPDDVVAAIAAVVRARELSIDGIVRRLSRGRVLLVLDNADHVIGALAVAVDALLAQTEHLRIVVTSRESLRLAQEHVVVLRPLVGDDAEDAWRLFSERAADARGGRAFHDEELAEARQLCAQLEGIPLALELAAARLDVLDVEQVREGIGGRGAGTGRHDSVRAAIGWTFDELDDDQRALLADVARFAGTFTVGAAAGTSGLDTARTSELLMQLVGRSLVAVDRSGTGRRRFRVLESTREFLADRDDPARVAAWRLRHRWWFADLASRLGPTLRTFEARDTMAVLDGFRADLAVAFEGAIEAGDREAAVRIAGWQAQYWFLRGLLREGRTRVERALALPGDPTDSDGLALTELANLAYQTGDAMAGFEAIARARAEGERRSDASVTAVALSREAFGRSMFGEPDLGEQLMAQALDLLPDAQAWARAEVHMSLGQLRRAQARPDDALAALSESHRIASSVGYTWMITSSQYIMAKSLVDARRPREAIAVARSAIAAARANEDAAGALAVVHVAAGACAFVERHEVGARLMGAVDELGRRYDYDIAAAEGDDARRLREAVAQGLTPGEFEHEYRNGRRLGWDEVSALIERLPQTAPLPAEATA